MLSLTAEYGLRALVALARRYGRGPVLAREIAPEVAVPPNYLPKVLCALAKAGFLHSSRGVGGGFRLKHPPERIILRDVVEVFDGLSGRTSCLLGRGECTEEKGCAAHARWKAVWVSYLAFLNQTTLADLAGRDHTAGPVAKGQPTDPAPRG